MPADPQRGAPALGHEIDGFRLERVIGEGAHAIVYEATQLALDRRVAFKLLRDSDPELKARVRRLEWPEHANVVSLFGTGDCPHGPWLAMRLVTGGTLSTRRRAQPLLDQVAAALDAAHAAGKVHGDLTARDVLITADGTALVSDFGLGPADATADDDRDALAGLVRRHGGARRRARWPIAAGGLVAAGALVLVLALGGGGDAGDEAAPRVPAGTQTLGSALDPRDVATVDCNGRPPDGASRPCTVTQLSLAGRRTVAPRGGRITSWAVRGASGTLALQVLRASDGQLAAIEHSDDATISGPGLHVIPADLDIKAGDRVAVEVAPESAVGIRRGRQGATARWFGPLRDRARPPERGSGTGFDHELLVRVDVTPAG